MAIISIEVPDGQKCKECFFKEPGVGKFKDWKWCAIMKGKLPDDGTKLESCLNSEIVFVNPEN